MPGLCLFFKSRINMHNKKNGIVRVGTVKCFLFNSHNRLTITQLIPKNSLIKHDSQLSSQLNYTSDSNENILIKTKSSVIIKLCKIN